MTRLETVTAPVTLGAGRHYAYRYPTIGVGTTNAFSNMDVATGRPGGQRAQSFWGQFDTGASPAPKGSTIYNGRVGVALTSNTVPTGTQLSPSFAGTNRPLTMPFQTVRAASGSPQYVDDCWCWSFSALLAFDAIPGAITGDVGLCVGVGTRCVIRGVNQFAGIEFGPTNVGTLGVICRQVDAGAVTLAQNVTGVADMTLWHKYEIRLLGPTAQGEASVKFMIDGQTQLALSYGAGTVLPDQKQGSLGFTPGLINLNANAATTRMYIAADSVSVCCATEESALP